MVIVSVVCLCSNLVTFNNLNCIFGLILFCLTFVLLFSIILYIFLITEIFYLCHCWTVLFLVNLLIIGKVFETDWIRLYVVIWLQIVMTGFLLLIRTQIRTLDILRAIQYPACTTLNHSPVRDFLFWSWWGCVMLETAFMFLRKSLVN